MKYLSNILFILICFISNHVYAVTALYLKGDAEHYYSFPDGLTYTDNDGVFDAQTIIWHPSMGLPVGNTVEIDFKKYNSIFENVPDFAIVFSAPVPEMLDLRVYDNLYRYPFHIHNGLNQAGFALSSGHSGCNSVGGQFEVQDISISNNILTSFAADFTFICEPGTGNQVVDGYEEVALGNGETYLSPIFRDAELFGSIRINSDIPLTVVPLPAAISLFCFGFISLIGISRRKKS